MRSLMLVALCTLGLGFVANRGFGQDKTGLKVGTMAPAFNLKDQNNKERSLNDFLKKGKVALVFYRSATW